MSNFEYELEKMILSTNLLKLIKLYNTINQYIDKEYSIDYIIDAHDTLFPIVYNNNNDDKIAKDIKKIKNIQKNKKVYCIYVGEKRIDKNELKDTYYILDDLHTVDGIYKYITKYTNLDLLLENNCIKTKFNIDIYIDDIDIFNISTIKANNDTNNKKREIIIYLILNEDIPNDWYKKSYKWNNMKHELHKFLYNVNKMPYISIDIEYKAGRKYNYDYEILYHFEDESNKSIKLEFKNNCEKVMNYPQFLSVSAKNFIKNKDYGEFFYDNYIEELSLLNNLTKPNKDDYLKYLYSSNYDKLQFFRQLKDNENIIQDKKKELVMNSISEYIKIVDIDIDTLNKKFKDCQIDKIYMLYSKNKFYIDKIFEEELTITGVSKIICKNTIVLDTKNPNTKIHMLLRWKNHLGILYPAWQISIKR